MSGILIGIVLIMKYFYDNSRVRLFQANIFWSLVVSYVIFACVHGYSSLLNRFLSHRLWQPFSRLSFNFFLLHVVVMHLVRASETNGLYFSKFVYVRKSFNHSIQDFQTKFFDLVSAFCEGSRYYICSFSSFGAVYWNADDCFGEMVFIKKQKSSDGAHFVTRFGMIRLKLKSQNGEFSLYINNIETF